MVNSVYGDSFILGDGEVDQGRFVVINGSHFKFFCFTGNRFARVDPAGSSSLLMGRLMEPFHFRKGGCEKAEINLLIS